VAHCGQLPRGKKAPEEAVFEYFGPLESSGILRARRYALMNLAMLFFILYLIVNPLSVRAENVDPNNDGSQYAYGENIGWLNAEPGGEGGPGVVVEDTKLTGYIWGENIGWVSLSCENTGTCGTVDYGVNNDGSGKLSGYAWGENVGWINFAPSGGGVTINSSGNFSGWAWGENIGWLHFRNPSIPYKVQTEWQAPESPAPSNPALIILDPGCVSSGTPVLISVDVNQGREAYFSYWVNETSYCLPQAARWVRIGETADYWTTDNVISWTPTTPGRKTVVVWVTDDPVSSTCPWMVGLSCEVDGSVCIDPVAVSLDPADGAVDEEVTITATGAAGVTHYRFFVNSVSYCLDPEHPSWTEITEPPGWSTDNTCRWTPTQPGLYTLVVWTTNDTNEPCKGIGGMSYSVQDAQN